MKNQECIFLKQSLNEWRDRAKAYESESVATLTVERHQTIWINVVNGVGDGDFLRRFGAAFHSADDANKRVLLRASTFFIARYELGTPEYLNTGEEGGDDTND